MQVQYVLRLLPCTHQDDIRLRANHSAVKTISFCSCCSYSNLQVFQSYGHWWNGNLTFQKAPQEKQRGNRSRDRRVQEVDPPWSINRSGNCLFKSVVTSLCMCGGARSCKKKQHFCCLHADGSSSATPKFHGK
jgi:hypothetical protein